MGSKYQPSAAPTGEGVLLRAAVRIVAAHVTHSHVPADTLRDLITRVYETLAACRSMAKMPPVPQPPQPAVNPKLSVTDHWLICLEDGERFRTLRRHLKNRYGLTPDQYRVRWGLPDTYPMVAPEYSRRRSALTKEIWLGKRGTGGARNAYAPPAVEE